MGDFKKKYLKFTEEKYLSTEAFENFKDIADVYFSGSDQVWNTGWNNGVIPPLYLSFVPDNKPRYAYASSFGKSKLEEKDVKEAKKYLEKFEKISVREDTGVEILKNQFNIKDAIRILDPTLAMDAEFWRKIKPRNKIKEDYILIYNLNRSKEFDQYAEELAKKTGYKLYRFCTRLDQIFRNGKSIVMPDIFEFVTLVDDAKLVLTDSFHATAFSINMNTEPICIYPNEYSSRLSDFLKLVDCTDRHAKDFNDFSVLNKKTNFNKVNKILNEERKKVDEYLSDIVSSYNERKEK